MGKKRKQKQNFCIKIKIYSDFVPNTTSRNVPDSKYIISRNFGEMMPNKIRLKQYSAMLDNAPYPIFITNKMGDFIVANKHFCETLGYSKNELFQMNSLDTYIESEIFLYTKHLSEIIKHKDLLIERAMKRKDGDILYTQIHYQLIDEQMIKGMIQHSSIKKKLNEFSEKDKIFQQITEHIRSVFFLVDVKTNNFLYISPSYEKIWGKSIKSLLKNPISWMEMIHPEDKTRVFKLYKKHLKIGFLNISYKIVLDDKSVCYIHARTFPVFNENKQIYRIAGIAEDITAQKLIQEERLKFSEKIKCSLQELIVALSKTLEQRDRYTAGHQNNVATLSEAIAKEMNLSKDKVDAVKLAAQIHDIGKVGVPFEILSKPGKLTELEYDFIKTHPEVGYHILKNVSFPWPIAEIVREHHERLDGSGYPRGLKADEIKIEAKIIAVADTIDAIASNRPYRPALGLNMALDEIYKFSNILFDARVVNVCRKLFLEKRINLYQDF